jgi:hypothetical protein
MKPTIIDAEPLQQLKENEVWCCESGHCENIAPVLCDFERSKETTPDGVIIALTIEKYWGCDKCGSEIYVYEDECA